jgi:ubiquitin carboxyl-terminal hydrolase L3
MMESWPALESNPEVFTQLTQSLLSPVSIPFEWSDIWTLDGLHGSELPTCRAVVFLFDTRIADSGSANNTTNADKDASRVWYMEQTISNACGTVAIVHTLANLKLDYDPLSALGQYLSASSALSPKERGQKLRDLKEVHLKCAQGGQTQVPDEGDDVDLHFLAYVCVDGQLWELDGRNPVKQPIWKSACSPDAILTTACDVIKKEWMAYMDSAQFSLIGLFTE